MSAPGASQRAFSPAHATCAAPTDVSVAALAVVHALACGLGVAVGDSLNRPVPRTGLLLLFLLVLQGGAVVLYWQLGIWLEARRGYRGADPYLRLCAGITLVDLVVRAAMVISGGGFGIATINVLGPYGIMLSYPHLQFFALGTLLIALGYSLLRMPRPGPTVRGYALASIAMGMLYAGFLGNLTFIAAIAADLYLARLFWPIAAVGATTPAPRGDRASRELSVGYDAR